VAKVGRGFRRSAFRLLDVSYVFLPGCTAVLFLFHWLDYALVSLTFTAGIFVYIICKNSGPASQKTHRLFITNAVLNLVSANIATYNRSCTKQQNERLVSSYQLNLLEPEFYN